MTRWWWRRRERDLDDELASHFRLAIEDHMARGASRAEAESAARREFGSELLVREVTRRQWSWFWLERVAAEFALALRGFRRSPRFFLAGWVCVAVGIGAAVTIFAVLEAVMLRPLPYEGEHELVVVEPVRERRSTRFAQLTQEELNTILEAGTLARVGTWRSWEIDIADGGDLPERVLGAETSRDLLPVLGVQPLHGRWATGDEEGVVVLSHDLWQRRYGGDEGVLGRTILVGGTPHEVIGVMPAEFSVPEGTQLWRPLGDVSYPPHILFYGGAIGRLAPGAELPQARAELVTLLDGLTRRYPHDYPPTTYRVTSLRQSLLGPLRRPILLFQMASLLVLLTACANVAALQLARGTARRREFAIRSAIGAGRASLSRHVLIECVALAVIGGLGGLLLSIAGLRLVELSFPDGVPSYLTLTLDARVVAAAFCATLGSALLFGAAPALRAGHARAAHALDGSTGVATVSSPAGRRFTSVLVAAEIAVSVVLVTGAVLLVRGDIEARRALGFEPDRMLSVRVPLGYRDYAEPDQRRAFYAELEERLRALPGVEAVTSSFNEVPLDGPVAGFVPLRLPQQGPESATTQRVSVQWVGPEYARTLGARLLDGRDLAASDVRAGERSALANRAFRAAYLSSGTAVGSTVLLDGSAAGGGTVVRIVGVIADVLHERPPAEVPPTLYMPHPEGTASQTFMLRTMLPDPMTLGPAVRQVVAGMDPDLTVSRFQAQSRVVHRAYWRERLQRNVLGIFAALALLLTASGVYGVLSYLVAQRTAEFGIRTTVGASSRQVLRMMLLEALAVAVPGVLIGTLAALWLNRLLSSAAYGMPASDPATQTLVASALLAVAVLAAAAPARRAARLDPLAALNDRAGMRVGR